MRRGGDTNLVTVGDTEAEGGYAGTAESNAEKADELLSDVGPSGENLLYGQSATMKTGINADLMRGEREN